MGKRYYSPHELMQILGLSRNIVYKYLAEGTIKSVRLGHGKYRVPAAEVARWQQATAQSTLEPLVAQTSIPTEPLVPPSEHEVATKSAFWNSFSEAPSRVHQGADLFDWMVALLSIMVGSGMFLFSYYGFAVAREWQVAGPAMLRFVLLGYGFSVLASTVIPMHSRVHRLIDFLGAGVYVWFALVVWPLAYVEAAVLYMSIAATLLACSLVARLDARAKFGMLMSLVLLWGTTLYFVKPDAYQTVIPFFGLSRTVQVVLWGMSGIAYALLYLYAIVSLPLMVPVLTTLAAIMFIYIAYFMIHMGAWDRVLAHVIVGIFYFLVPYYQRFEVTWNRGKRDVLVETLVIMVVFVVAGAVIGGANNMFRGAGMQQDLHRDVTTLSSELTRMVDQAKQEVVTLSGSRLLLTAVQSDDRQMMSDMIRDYIRSSKVLMQASVISPDGTFIEYYPHTEEILLTNNVSFREYFIQFIQGKAGDVFVTPRAFHGGFSGVPWLVVVAAPMYDPHGKLVAVVAARFDLQRLQDLLTQHVRERNESLLILDQSGRALAATAVADRFALMDTYLHFIDGEQQHAGTIPMIAYVDSGVVGENSPYLGWTTSRRVEGVPWYVIAVQTSHGEGRLVEGFLVIGLLFTVMLILFFILAWRQRLQVAQRFSQERHD